MARGLDPSLQKIIDKATSQTVSLNASQPAMFSMAGVRKKCNYSSSNARESFNFPSTIPMSDDFELDNFDRNVLQPAAAFRGLPARSGNARAVISPKSLHDDVGPAAGEIQSFYVRQNTKIHPMPDWPCQPGFRTASQIKGQWTEQPARPEPKGIFHGIQQPSLPRFRAEEPKTPINLASYSYTPPGQLMELQSSASEMSSPSNRVSLRRISKRPSIETYATETRLHLDDALLGEQVHGTSPNLFTRGALYPSPPRVQGIQLISPHELPDRFRQVFPYQLFNAMQSKCFFPVFKTGDNIVISAPTGSGKTALMELAICKLVQESGSGQFKVVYQAPTKSLCSERVRDWQKKLSHLNLPCAELTGDTDSSEMRAVGNAAVIVTTPEKWDSITRKWKDYIKLLQMVKLFLIDEVHVLKDVRGATLEAVVSRMKTIGASVRFVALSATVPNSQDIAVWLGKDPINGHLPAHCETFGEEFRPVKLQKYVYGFGGNSNDFAFDTTLDTKLPGLLAKHSRGKPLMVFCFTRKSCENTAAKLAQWWAGLKVAERPWSHPTGQVAVGSKELRDLVGCGVSFHHAGLEATDRSAVETAYLRGDISVICCTSTLAVGVNLPCHLVVVKNTLCFTDGGLKEYSDLEIMQMLGRAGRPQFDDCAIAIIMTRSEKIDRYEKMISGHEIVESTLHLNLIEHLNSEIALGTVHDVSSAKRWLSGTFLSVRVRQNAAYYKFSCDTGSQDADERLERVCEKNIELLQIAKLITDDQRFACTEYGLAMSKYMVQFETMKLLLNIPQHAKMTQILHFIAQASEFKDLRMKPNERATYREFNKSPFIKSTIKENVNTFAHKVSLLVQVQLGGIDLPTEKEFNNIRRQFLTEKMIVFDRLQRLVRCLVECKAYERDAVATCNALELARSISAGFWENTTLQLRQIPNIGSAAARKLVQANVKTVHQFAAMDTIAIERILSRNPPFGRKILESTTTFPRLTLKAEVTKKILKDKFPVGVQVTALLGFSNAKFPTWNRRVICMTFVASISNGTLAHIWRGLIRKMERGFEVVFLCELTDPKDTIICQLACEEIVGTIQTVVLEPNVPASAFPQRSLDLQHPGSDSEEQSIAQRINAVSTRVVTTGNKKQCLETDIGSDYGGDSVFGDFVDIDDFDEEVDINQDIAEKEALPSQPVRMSNGKWQCNHKCSDGQGNKNGQPCKHRCCREGLDKPRRLQKKKVRMESTAKVPSHEDTQSIADSGGNATKSKPTSEMISKIAREEAAGPRLKLAEHQAYFGDVEELDLVDEPLVMKDASKHAPIFNYGSGFPPNLSLMDNRYLENSSEIDFPSPSALMGVDCSEMYGEVEDMDASHDSYDEEDEMLDVTKARPQEEKSFENNALDFHAFDTSPTMHLSSEKRHACPLSSEPDPKHRRVGGESEKTAEGDQARPEWVKEIDPEFVAFFEGWAEFV